MESYRFEDRRVTAAFGPKALIVPPGSRPEGGGHLVLAQGHSAGELCWGKSPVFSSKLVLFPIPQQCICVTQHSPGVAGL